MQKEFLRAKRAGGRVKFRIRIVLSDWRGRTHSDTQELEEVASKNNWMIETDWRRQWRGRRMPFSRTGYASLRRAQRTFEKQTIVVTIRSKYGRGLWHCTLKVYQFKTSKPLM